MKTCKACRKEFEGGEEFHNGRCYDCHRQVQFAAFAKKVNLSRYPDPTGERYVYSIDGDVRKKSESTDFIDELWNVLVTEAGSKGLRIED